MPPQPARVVLARTTDGGSTRPSGALEGRFHTRVRDCDGVAHLKVYEEKMWGEFGLL